MIKRIKLIKNIGTFSDYVASPPIQLEKLTFVYGLNTYGKTTLSDIFQSVKNDDFSFLESRKSIPNISGNQQININYKLNNTNQEQELKTQNGSWSNNKLKDNIEIFSSEFIHKNLFTGLSVDRTNKENFTQFILGNTGVELAIDIKNKRQKLNILNKELPSKIPDFVKDRNEQELIEFLNLDIRNLTIEDLKSEYTNKHLELKKEKEQLDQPEKILAKPDPCLVEFVENNLLDSMQKVNNLLNSSYKDISDEALKKVNEHIAQNFQNIKIAENWLKTGKDNIKGNNCSFCGQELNIVTDLMKSYNQFFNQEYGTFIEELESNFSVYLKNIKNSFFKLKQRFNNELSKANSFNETVNDGVIKQKITELKEQIELLNEDELNNLISDSLKKIEKLFDEKKLKPHTSIYSIDLSEIKQSVSSYKGTAVTINKKIRDIIDLVNIYKEKYKDIGKLKSEINQKEDYLIRIDFKIKRIEQNSYCEMYRNSVSEIEELKREITFNETELETNQTSYLQNYYSKIDSLFKQFGSSNFTLEKTSSARGLQPVYSLKVKFHGQDISEKDFSKVFSESDKRALALAVFWTKIEMKTMEEKANSIIILDDPVTSFDDNRISKSIDLFKSSIKEINQLIILTHYPNFIKRFFEKVHAESTDLKFLELKKDSQSSKIEVCDIDKLIKSDYQLTFEKITGFIDRNHENCIKGDLRKFLEACYLPHFFPHKLIQAKKERADLSQLSKKIDYIFSENEEVKNKFHSFRENTNPDAHIFTLNNIEDVRSFAKEMFDYLYQ